MDRPRVIAYRSAEKNEATLLQTIGLYIAVFFATGVIIVFVLAGAAWVLSLFSTHSY